MKVDADDKLDQEVTPTDDGSSMTENVTSNVEDEKPTDQSAPPKPSKADWDGPDDPDNPQNWSQKKKWALTYFAGMLIPVIHALY